MIPSPAATAPPQPPPEDGRAATLRVFRCAVMPFVDEARSEFARAMAGADRRAIDRIRPVFGFENLFEARWSNALVRLAERTLILEVNVARLRGQLTGATPAERFASFGDLLASPAYLSALLSEYPELLRALATVSRLRARADAELVTRLARDLPAVAAHFGARHPPGRLSRLDHHGGDSHRGGRCVSIVEFESGLEVVYKPRSLAVEVHYADLAAWLSAHGLPLDLPTPHVLLRRGYGWVQRVRHAACRDGAEVAKYYQRLGAHLALLYALEATDLHLENVIATGSAPMLVDLEALFQPRTPVTPDVGQGTVARGALLHSVLRVGLLPNAHAPAHGDRPLDRSGVGGAPGQLSPHPLLQYQDAGTDVLRLAPEFVSLATARNQPMLNGARVDAGAFTADLVTGFASAYGCMVANRVSLLAADGPIERFAHDRVRFIARGTATYDDCLMRSVHPGALRSSADRTFVLNRVLGATGAATHLMFLRASERYDLRRGDIPFFSTSPGAVCLADSRGHAQRSPITRAPLDVVRERLRSLDADDCARQIALIRAGMATLRTGVVCRLVPPLESTRCDAVTRTALLAAGHECAERVSRAALTEGDHHAWIGITTMREQFWTLGQLGAQLYDGSAGIALFLAYAGHVTRDTQLSNMARRVTHALARHVREQRKSTDRVPAIGVFTGQAGLVYLFSHLGVLWKDRDLIAAACQVALTLDDGIAGDDTDDLIGGTSGALCAVLGLYRVAPRPELLALACRAGEHLLSRATSSPDGLAWASAPRGRPLAGLSHGNAGIALGLWKLATLTTDARYARAAIAACDFERTFWDHARGNWEDRRVADVPGVMNAWCHGAPGIALARIAMLAPSLFSVPATVTNDLRWALAATREQGAPDNLSLCHGVLGNVAPLFEAGRVLGDVASAATSRARLGAVLADLRANGARCGTPDGVEASGLMTGMAGIGYQLLRCAAPRVVPCVLTLGAPPARTASNQIAPTRRRTSSNRRS